MYTSHGHHIPGTPLDELQPLRQKCGGFALCAVCLRDAAKVLVASETHHHHILIALTPQNATEDQKKRNLLTNAIAWTLFGDENKEVVKVTQGEADIARVAAERCMVALREYERMMQETAEDESPLVAHARRELTLRGDDQRMIDCLTETVRAFASYGHSGGSASVAIPTLNHLLQFKNLTDLTDDPSEWMVVARDEETGKVVLWQSRRNAEAFSKDGGKTYSFVQQEEVHESALSGGQPGAATSDEHEREEPVESQVEEAPETPQEGVD